MSYLIGIDAGTSALKTVVFDETGAVIASASQAYPMDQPHNGWAQQDPNDWKCAMLETLQTVVQSSGIQAQEIKGIGLSGQMHGLVMLDEAGEVIRPAIVWCDQRTKIEVEEMKQLMPQEEWIKESGNPPLTGWTAAKLLWVRKHEPQAYARCKHILLPKDYLRFVLTGVFASDVSDASGMQLMDVRHRCWSKRILALLNIEEALLPALYESCEITGTLLAHIAQYTGLCKETIVVGGAGDNAASAIGTGVVSDGTAFTTIGTSGVVYAHTASMVYDPLGRIHTCCAAIPNCWHVMGVTQAAGLSLQWAKNTFCEREQQLAKEQCVDVYTLLNEMAQQIPVGSDRLIYLPYLMGERTPHLDPDCRGVFFGLSAKHQKAHLIRAVMEGVCYSLQDCLNVLREQHISINSMLACGGGAKSEVWREMMADVYDCKVSVIKQGEGAVFGAAILAGVGCGIYPDVVSACEQLIHIEQTTMPNKEHVVSYKQYHKLYQTVYTKLQTSFQSLADLAECRKEIAG